MKNLTFKAAMLNDSQPTVNRQSTDGQSQRHCKQTPLSKRWKVLMTLVFLFTLGIGQMWGATTLFTTNFSTTDGWSNENLTTSSQTETTKTIKGKTITIKGYKNSSAKISSANTSGGTFTFTGNNMTECSANSNVSDLNYYIAIPVSGIVAGTVTVTCTTSSGFKFYYTYDDGNTGKVKVARTQAAANNTFTLTGLTNTSATIYLGTSGKTMTSLTITTPELMDLSESAFYTTYANSNKAYDVLIDDAEFPSYITTSIVANQNSNGCTSTVSTPHDFSALSSGTTYYRLKAASAKTIIVEGVSHVKSIRVYGNGDGNSTKISTTVTKLSGTGSVFTVSDMSSTNDKKKIVEYTTGDLTAKSGYNINTYYTYTLSFNGGFDVWGIYVEYACTNLDAPTGLSCTAHTENSLTFGWTAASNASSYDVKLWTNSGCTGDPVASGNVTTTYKTFTGLDASTTYYCKVQSKGNGTTCCTEGGITSALEQATDASSCAATIPGNISKGAASGGTGTITLTAAGDVASGDTWYWQDAEDGTATNLGSGKTKDVNAAGTYYIRSYNATGTCWSAAKSVTVDAADLLTAINPTLSYAANVFVGGTLSPTLEGNTGSGSVSYELNDVTPAGCMTIDEAGVVTAVAPGTATVTATITKSGYYAGNTATSGTITVIAAPTHMVENRLVITNGASWGSSIYTTDGTNITNLSAFNPSRTGDGAINVNKKTANGSRSTNVSSYTSEDADNYMVLSFTVADGKRLKVSDVSIEPFSVSDKKYHRAWLANADGNKIVEATAELDKDACENVFANFDFSENAVYLTGTNYLKLWTWGSTNGYRLNTPIYIDGVISDIPDTYSVTYVPNNGVTPAETMTDSNSPYEADAEVTLLSNTFTAPTGQLFDGWVATYNDGENDHELTITNGKFTMPAYNVTVTAQWADATATYDITYVSDHGTAPDAENAASVVLAELSESGWQHVGWTADADVTVDAETVTAGTLIANGKTAILSADVEFTAVWNQIYTVTYNANGGSCATTQATWKAGDEALVLPAATKDNFDFVGWYDAAVGGNKIASPYTPSASIELFAHYMPKLVQAIYSNSFDAFIKNQAVTVFYLQDESEPTLTSIKVLGVETPVFEEADGNIKVTIESVDYIFPVTKTAVAPYTYVNGDPITFDGTETYIKSGYSFSTTAGKEGWRFSKNDTDWSRETPGNNRIYFFIGAAESITLTSGCSSARAMKVYRNGTQIFDGTMPKNSSSPNYVTLTGSNAPAMYAVVSNQTDGDGAIKIMALAPWVSTTGVALKEGEDPISAKSIWESTSFTLTAVVTPDNASNKTITWTSSNDAVATVDNGVVTGVAANATPVTITATTVDGVYAECVVTVTEAPSPCKTPTITTQPATQSYCAGSEPTLSVLAEVTDGGTLHYAWFKDDAAFGNDAATCTVDGVGTYKVVVTNKVDGKLDASVTSNEAVITLNVAAAITTQPTNKRDVVSGDNVTLSVVATNATGYQWYSCDDAEKANAEAISGAESANYEFACTANGFYYCVVGNACGEDIVSNVVSVKLEPEGCNLIGTPSGNAYTQAGEWSIYPVNSNGQHDPEGTDFGTCKAFDEETNVNCVNTRRFAIKFEKDVESVTIYARGGTGRTFDKVSVADEMAKNAYTELTDITKQLVTIDEAGKEYIATAEGMIPGGKYAWFDFSGSFSGVFKICYTAALAMPKLPTLVNQELCAGADYVTYDASITNAADCEGTVSYEWYETSDTENPVATTATYTPDADATYYVVVKHAAAGHATRVAQSANLTVAHFAAPALESYSEDVFQHMGTEATLSVTATGSGLAYTWYTCDAEGNNAVAVDPAVNAASMHIASVAEGVRYYKVAISNTCDATTLSHIFKVEGWDQLEQVDVTATTTWDMTNVAASEINLASFEPSKQNDRLLLANIEGVNNNASFNSQALYFEGQRIGRTENNVKYVSGQYVQFNVTVPGMVSVTFASNGDAQRTIQINGKECSRTTTSSNYIRYDVAVEPGSVEIKDVQGYVRISKIEFKAEDNYHRTVNPAYLGTLCWTNNAILGGAKLYEFQGRDAHNYLVFDEVLENRLEAGKPYIFMPENGNTEIKVYNTDDAQPLDEDQDQVNNMYGTITGTTLSHNNEHMYYFSSNHIWRVADFTVDVEIPAYYCYVDYLAVLEGPLAPVNPAPGRRRVTMGVQGSQIATGMGEIEASETPMKVMIDGQLFIIRGEKMFDATGRLVK